MSYIKKLKRFHLIECLGFELYQAMSIKERNRNSSLFTFYDDLAKTENAMKIMIESELIKYGVNFSKKNYFLVNLAKILFKITPINFLRKTLKLVLKKMIYSNSHKKFSNKNRILWENLVNHEQIQRSFFDL